MRTSVTTLGMLTFLLGTATGVFAQHEWPVGPPITEPGEYAGESNMTPYKGTYSPASSSGILTALENFSNYVEATRGFNPRLHKAELFTHYVGDGSKIMPKWAERGVTDTGWWGHCNGLAAAACLEKDPVERTIRGGDKDFKFSRTELVELLNEAYYSANAVARGQRGWLKTADYTKAKELIKNDAPVDEWRTWYKKATRADSADGYSKSEILRVAENGISKFEDIRPHEFVQTLDTTIGKAKLNLVVEKSAGESVWNYAGHKYSLKLQNTPDTTPEGYKIQKGDLTIETQAGTSQYTYEQHLSRSGQLVTSQWTGNSVTNHPDFTWLPTNPRWLLPLAYSSALTNNLTLAVKNNTELIDMAKAHGNSVEGRKFRNLVEEVTTEIIDPNMSDANAIKRSIYETTREALRNHNSMWNSLGRSSIEGSLQGNLFRLFNNNSRFNLDLYNVLSSEILPDGNRAELNILERVRAAARGDGNGLQARIADRGPQVIRNEAMNAASFGLAYLAKEAIFAAGEGRLNPKEFYNRSVKPMKDIKGFWVPFGGFVGASTATNYGIKSGATALASSNSPMLAKLTPVLSNRYTGTFVPLMAGMLAIQGITGTFDLKNAAISTASYGSASLAVGAASKLVGYTPGGFVGKTATLAAVLTLGQLLDQEIHKRVTKDNGAFRFPKQSSAGTMNVLNDVNDAAQLQK